MFTLSFQNSSNIPDADIQAFLQDLQAQITNDFAPQWGVEANVELGGNGWPITIVNHPGASDPTNALGYHHIDQNGVPYGRVFAQFAQDNDISWTSVASHEALEILADPLINSVSFYDTSGGNGTTGILVPQEVCDAPERLTYPGAVNGTEVSDFVYPTWFRAGYTGQVDQLGRVPGPFLLVNGGFISYDEIHGTGWKQQQQPDRAIKSIAQQQMQRPRTSVQLLPRGRQAVSQSVRLTNQEDESVKQLKQENVRMKRAIEDLVRDLVGSAT